MLEQFGWSDALRHQFAAHASHGLIPARVLIQQRGLYVIATDVGELSATLAGKLAFEALEGDYPVAGDWVAVAARPAENAATIHHVLERRTQFVRRAAGPGAARVQVVAANVDVAILAASLNADLSARRLERYLAAAWDSGADPVIALTKADMCDDPAGPLAEVENVARDVPVLVVSSVTGAGIDALKVVLAPGGTAAVLGSSGVGKSTLVNALAGRDHMASQPIREADARGRHTTTHRELVLLPSGALILDTPGMRELGLWDAEEGLSTAFGDIEALAAHCRFQNCGHTTEPGCAIRTALEDGTLDPARWKAHGKLQRELEFQHRKEDPRVGAAARKRWIQRNKAQRARTKARRSLE